MAKNPPMTEAQFVQEELTQARERIVKLEAALVRISKLAWCVAIDGRNDAQQKAESLEWTVKEFQAAGMDAWLPEHDEVRGIFTATDETIAQINRRREKRLVERVLAHEGKPG